MNGNTQAASAQPYRPSNPAREAENHAWVALYKDVNDPALAAEMVEQLDEDMALRRTHLALYLMAKQTLRREEQRQRRNAHVSAFLHLIVLTLVVKPLKALRDIAVGAMPATYERQEAAQQRRRTLKSNLAKKDAVAATPATATPDPDSQSEVGGTTRRAA